MVWDTGNGVVVQGFVNASSAPLLVILDTQVQRLSTPEDNGSDCGVIFSEENLTITSHNLTIIHLSTTGSAQLTISDITAFPPTVLSANIPNPTGSQSRIITPLPSLGSQLPTGATVLPKTTPPPSSPQTPNTSQTATVPPVMIASPSSSQNTFQPPSVSSTPFMTTTGMTVAVFGGLVGAAFAMLILLMVFILLRRRVTRNAAQDRDRESSSDREPRVMEDGKIRTFISTSEAPKGRLTQFILENGSVSPPGSIASPLSIMTEQPDSSLPSLTPTVSGTSTRSQPGIPAQTQQSLPTAPNSTASGTSSLRTTPVTAAIDDKDQHVSVLLGDDASLAPPSDRSPQAPSHSRDPSRLLAPSLSPRSILSHMAVSPWTSRSSVRSAGTSVESSSRTGTPPRNLGPFALDPSRQGRSRSDKVPYGFF
ncbi:hypothetical protein BU17DRAFT_95080 [Hysterangium stoloniferum]|nr:hypothetical protein BU17DRAFT_95080 [Hysterangium stoloniferum]